MFSVYGAGLGLVLGVVLMVWGIMMRHQHRTVALYLQGIGAVLQYGSAVLGEPLAGLVTVFLWLLQTLFVLLILALWQNARYLAQVTWFLAILTTRIAFLVSQPIGWLYGVAGVGCMAMVLMRKRFHSPLAFGAGIFLLVWVMMGSQSALV